jgi:hypothetical protein
MISSARADAGLVIPASSRATSGMVIPHAPRGTRLLGERRDEEKGTG